MTSSLVVDSAILGILCVAFVQSRYWFQAAIVGILFRYFTSDLGRRAIKTLPRDIRGLMLLFRVKWNMHMAFKRNLPLHHYFLSHVRATPNKDCVVEVDSGRSFTFEQVNNLSNMYANALPYKCGETVALFLENGADFLAAWLGLSKLGVITAWINSNLKLQPLAHSIRVSKCNAVITCNSLSQVLQEAIDAGLLPSDLVIYSIDSVSKYENYINLAPLLKDSSEPSIVQGLNFQSIVCYIYTSGTTGNPKPAVIKHFRYYFIAMGSGSSFGIRSDDRMYITMPMYHSAAGILGTGQAVVRGSTLVVRKKFSARNFWSDAKKHDCTVSQYIGEICRYLLAQPQSEVEKSHSVRLMFGNGLRPEIWAEFVDRFDIAKIGELYGSTEGNSNIVNIDNYVGACGFFPIYPGVAAFYPVRLVKVDPQSGELMRDENGLCISCRPGDTGEMVGLIKKDDPLLRFEGYVDKADTAKKVIRDVIKKGDYVFSSGDILYWDELGYLYFKDRRGDTYRWRGENVSTMEVEGVLQPIMCIEDATVFGVEVRGREGRAGMIGATLRDGTDLEVGRVRSDSILQEFLDQVSARLTANLASYAIPVFLRICRQVDRTGTFKLKKSTLQKDGFDPAKCNFDPLFYFDPTGKHFKPLDEAMYEAIQSGSYSKV